MLDKNLICGDLTTRAELQHPDFGSGTGISIVTAFVCLDERNIAEEMERQRTLDSAIRLTMNLIRNLHKRGYASEEAPLITEKDMASGHEGQIRFTLMAKDLSQFKQDLQDAHEAAVKEWYPVRYNPAAGLKDSARNKN